MADVTIQFQSDPATNIYGYGNGFVVHFFGKTEVLFDLNRFVSYKKRHFLIWLSAIH